MVLPAVREQTGTDPDAFEAMQITRGPVQMPSGRRDAEFTLRLPEGR